MDRIKSLIESVSNKELATFEEAFEAEIAERVKTRLNQYFSEEQSDDEDEDEDEDRKRAKRTLTDDSDEESEYEDEDEEDDE